MSDNFIGFIGVAIIFTLAVIWAVVEDHYKSKNLNEFKKRLAKYDKQNTKYDTTKKKSNSI